MITAEDAEVRRDKPLNEITSGVIRAAMRVHTALGPGLLESAYEACLAHVLRNEGVDVKQQVALPISFEGVQIDAGYRIDLLVEDAVVVELKCVEGVLPVHRAQLLSYLKLSGKKVGLVINFNVTHLRDGIERLVNRF